jgi:hypothetical protein
MLSPDKSRDIAAGLVDAAGPLAVQCGMSKLGNKIRGGASPTSRVASVAVKESLDFAKAQDGCKAVIQVLEAVAVIVGLAEINKPAYVTFDQSTKNRFLRPDACTVNIRAGASEQLSKNFKASFTC